MSRAEHPTTTRRTLLSRVVPAVVGLGLAAALAACSAGQIAQTDQEEPGVNGASGNVGAIAIRDVQLAFPSESQGVYRPGSNARLILTVINTGETDDTLERITSPAATQVLINGSPNGTKPIPAGFSVASGVDVDDESVTASPAAPTTAPPPTSAAPTSGVVPSGPPSTPNGSVPPTAPTSTKPQLPGDVTVDLVGIRSVNGHPLRAGLTIPLTFYFQHAGHVTLAQVPIGAPSDNSAVG